VAARATAPISRATRASRLARHEQSRSPPPPAVDRLAPDGHRTLKHIVPVRCSVVVLPATHLLVPRRHFSSCRECLSASSHRPIDKMETHADAARGEWSAIPSPNGLNEFRRPYLFGAGPRRITFTAERLAVLSSGGTPHATAVASCARGAHRGRGRTAGRGGCRGGRGGGRTRCSG
jgi:hypothetical protein